MIVQTVGLPDSRYDIRIGAGVLEQAGETARRFAGGQERVAVVTDKTVQALYGERLQKSLQAAGLQAVPVVLEPGEQSKTPENLTRIWQAFAEEKINRSGLVLALGGGVVGDICGFAAATWMRGVRCVQIPTTLLAQVDSSVGGKTAVNLPQGKNLVGAFYQPAEVLIDTDTLSTLPERELRSGMAEVIKYGAIRSEELFALLKQKPGPDAMPDIIARCCDIKSRIVERDERDTGERMLLNFGHTFGHAVEQHWAYARYNHGEAVALGMIMAAAVGEVMGLTQAGTADALRAMLEFHGLETRCEADTEILLPLMALDKKSGGKEVSLVLVSRIGESMVHPIGFDELGTVMRKAEGAWIK